MTSEIIIPDWRWPNFSPDDVLSPDGRKLWKERRVFPIRHAALDRLQDFRAFVGKPLLVNFGQNNLRGYRSSRENMNLKLIRSDEMWGFSFHCQGVAFDLHSEKMPVEELHKMALAFGWPGIGYYPKRGFIHVDLRDGPVARW